MERQSRSAYARQTDSFSRTIVVVSSTVTFRRALDADPLQTRNSAQMESTTAIRWSVSYVAIWNTSIWSKQNWRSSTARKYEVVTNALGVGCYLHRQSLHIDNGGEGGIRTHDTLASMPHFECGAFDHSATSPVTLVGARWRGLSHSGNSPPTQERM